MIALSFFLFFFLSFCLIFLSPFAFVVIVNNPPPPEIKSGSENHVQPQEGFLNLEIIR